MKGFKIGNVEIRNKVVLAPMAGISNASYIKICEEMGLGYAITELISAEAIIRNNEKTFNMLNGLENINIPIALQIFGSNEKVISDAAKIICSKYPFISIIDINMGCPVPKVAVRSQSGSSLLKNPEKVKKIVSAVVNSVNIPVTVKIRSGWDFNSINAVEIAKAIEEAGGRAISVHARTRSQGYTGKADWNIIKQVKESVNIPVIGNGDITDCYLAKKMLDETNCDAIMIGRGALGNPWIIKDVLNYLNVGLEPNIISIGEKIDMIIKHINYLLNNKEEKLVVNEIRTHMSYYLKGIKSANQLKTKIFKTTKIFDIIDLLNEFKNEYGVDNNG